MTTSAPVRYDEFDTVLSWLDHEHRLLEILAYRIDGLTNMLRAHQHQMVCQAASDVQDVKDQLANAAVQRDLAVLNLSERWATPVITTLRDLQKRAGEAQQSAAEELREKIAQAALDVQAAQQRCVTAASAYRPS
jgi:hypothetical protein